MNSNGVTLILVLGVTLVVVVLANVALVFITTQSRLTYYQVNRIQGFYAAQAGINYALERLRVGDWTPDTIEDKYYCINGNVDDGVICQPSIVNDPDIPYNVQIHIYPQGTGQAGTTQLDVKVDYIP